MRRLHGELTSRRLANAGENVSPPSNRGVQKKRGLWHPKFLSEVDVNRKQFRPAGRDFTSQHFSRKLFQACSDLARSSRPRGPATVSVRALQQLASIAERRNQSPSPPTVISNRLRRPCPRLAMVVRPAPFGRTFGLTS